MPFCSHCGHQLAEGAKFCYECGAKVGATNTTHTNQRKTVYDGEIHKCPNCGALMEPFEIKCDVCGYEYDEDAEGVKWEDLPEDWVCPLCGVGKDEFSKE